MIAGDGVDRLFDPFERQPELRLVVLDCPRRVDDVRRDDHEPHGVLPRSRDELVAQDVLRGVSFARIADDQEGEISGIDAGRLDGEGGRPVLCRGQRPRRP